MAALFFACTTFEEGKWRPLRSDEIENVDSRPGIAKRGGDSRYGVIYKRLAEPVELEWIYKSDNDFWDTIFPIGYQPYMRCSYQHAYGLFENRADYDMYKDGNYGKYKIHLTEDFCKWVFEKTNQGKDVFPVDDIPDISGYMDKINKTKRFSNDSFMAIAEGIKLPKSGWKRAKLELFKYGYVIDKGNVHFISQEEIDQINASYPPERAQMLTNAKPFSFPLIVL